MTDTISIALAALRDALGNDAVRTGDSIPLGSNSDWSGMPPCMPIAWLRPTSTADISAALQICNKHRLAVVPQGGMTGLVGGSQPVPTSVALSLEALNRIEAVDPIARTMTVQAGVTLQAVQEAAAQAGCIFGVELGARGTCQIGGNLSTNAGGNGVVQYGMMREQTLGLEVVLADGTVLDMMRSLVKDNTGYDLKHLFIGAEGTLGVITRAVLRLRPLPAARVTAAVALDSCTDALVFLRQLETRFLGGVAAFELMWHDFVEPALQWTQSLPPFNAAHPLVALIDIVGSDSVALEESLQTLLERAMEDGLVIDAVVAQSNKQSAALWRIREAPAELSAHMDSITFDVSLPAASISHFAEAVTTALAARWPKTRTLRFGHLGDGNLHLCIDANSVLEGGGDGSVEQVEKLVYSMVAELKGSISAEHGIGLHKKQFVTATRTAAELDLMKRVKHALDPLGTLNPGKIL